MTKHMTRRKLLNLADQLRARFRAKYRKSKREKRKYITIEESVAGLAEWGRFIEYAIEQIKKDDFLSWQEQQEFANSLRDHLLDTYSAMKSSSISTTEVIAEIQRKLDELGKDLPNITIGEFNRRLAEINAELRELEGL